jgi:hypothetical protein
MANGHTSMSCPAHFRKATHGIYFTQQNAQQYQYFDLGHPCCTKNKHRTQLPSMQWLGAAFSDNTSNGNFTFYVNSATSLYPTKSTIANIQCEDDDVTIIISNTSSSTSNANFAGATFALNTKDAIADSRAIQIFIMEGTPVINKRISHFPLKVALTDGRELLSTHECNVKIAGLPTVLKDT